MNTKLDSYFQGRPISADTPLDFDIAQRLLDISISREFHIPYAERISDLEVSDYRFLSLYLQKENFWKNHKQ